MIDPRSEKADRARRRLNQIAGLGVAIWLAVFGLIPLLHSIDHKNDHVHLPGGGVVYSGERPTDSEPAPAPAPVDHGSSSLAHFGAALIALPIAFVFAAIVRRLIAILDAKLPLAPDRRISRAIWARGPPAFVLR